MTPSSPLPERKPGSLPVASQEQPEEESSLAADERAYEVLAAENGEDAFLEKADDVVAASEAALPAGDGSVPAPIQKDDVTVALEKILEDGLGEHVSAMPEEARVRFLYKGQETAVALTNMVRRYKVQAKRVIELLRSWLLTIPGVNKFFLEQEAKIKTDRILAFEKTYREQQENKP